MKKSVNFTLFGRPLGLVALSTLSLLLGYVSVAELLALCSFAVFMFAIWQARHVSADDFLHNRDIGYASWAPTTIAQYSLLFPGHFGPAVWFFSLLLASLFVSIWALRLAEGTGFSTFDPSVVAWSIPWTVCDLTAPVDMRPVAHVFGTIGVVLSAGVLLVAALRVPKPGALRAMRSLWYGVGGSAVLVMWVAKAGLAPPVTWGLVGFFTVLGAFWLLSVFYVGLRTHGAWSNLFSLCSVAKALLVLGALEASKGVFAIALATLVLDLRGTTLAHLHAWRKRLTSRRASGAPGHEKAPLHPRRGRQEGA